jgi:hypothetical protein
VTIVTDTRIIVTVMVLVRPAYTYSNVKTLSLAESLWLPFYVNMILRVLIYALK